MDLERERLLLRLVEEGLDRAPDERTAFLAAATDDERLAAEALALIEIEARDGALPELEVPGAVLDDTRGAVEVGTVIDGFEIVGPLGTGGMGRVFEARQLEPARHVALKTLRVGLDSDEARRRFSFEAEVLARLRHPRIAQVYAVGTFREEGLGGPREVPYFAMEFVEGARDLLSFSDEEGLERDERLGLFIAVCDAVQHGHDRGVLHRDLKASNLLVDGEGRPKVIDFGIARPVDPQSDDSGSSLPRTVTGAVYGTPASLSPEQLAGEGDVDVRADVYALGVMLYRLVCGAPPHDLEGMGLPMAARTVVENEPRRPSQLAPGLPRDLEAVLLHSVARDRERRYASVAALAADLRRFLASEPVVARTPSAVHQLALLARRHRLAFAASVVAVVAVVAGASAAAVFGVQSARDAERARLAAEEARAAEAEAVAAAADAERARGELAELSLDLVFEFAEPIRNLQGATEVRLELMRSGLGHLDSLEDVVFDDVDQAFELCRAYLKLGDILGFSTAANVGDQEGRRRAHGRAWEVLERITGLWPDDGRLPGYRASLLSRRGRELLDAGDQEGAAAVFEEALSEARKREAGGPLDGDLAEDLALALSNYGALRGMQGDHVFALAALLENQSLRSALLRFDPDSPKLREMLGHATAQVGAALLRNERIDESIAEYTRAIEIFDQLAADFPDLDKGPRGGVEARTAFSYVYLENSGPEEVEVLVSEALAILEGLAARDPADVTAERSAGHLEYNRGQAHLVAVLTAEERDVEVDELERLDAARAAFTCARSHFERLEASGAMMQRERVYFPTIDARLDEIEALVAELPSDEPE